MKRLASAIAAIALIGTPAFAADIPVKAAAPSPAPVYNWTGWYVGVNAGASMGNVKTDFNTTPVTVTASLSGNITGSGGLTTGFANSDREYPDGFIGGGQIGQNWQFSPIWVVGLEAHFQGAVEKDSNTLTNNFGRVSFDINSIGIPVTFSTVTNYQTKIEWFGTVRARMGYVWGNGEVMSYVTGGLAYGKVGMEGTNTVSALISDIVPPNSITQAFGHSQVNTGWVVGYGTEGHLPLMPGNWTWKIEGLYMDLGTLDAGGSGGSVARLGGFGLNPNTITGVLTVGPVHTHSHFTDGILRGGLNYKFY